MEPKALEVSGTEGGVKVGVLMVGSREGESYGGSRRGGGGRLESSGRSIGVRVAGEIAVGLRGRQDVADIVGPAL